MNCAHFLSKRGESWIARVVEEIRRVRIADLARCGERAREHRKRLARRSGREDGHRESLCRGHRLRMLDVEEVVPADEHPKDAIPGGDREKDEESRAADVAKLKPPRPEIDGALNRQKNEHGD